MEHELKIVVSLNNFPRICVGKCACGWHKELFGKNVAKMKKSMKVIHEGHVAFAAEKVAA